MGIRDGETVPVCIRWCLSASDKVVYNLDAEITKRDSPHPKLVPLNKFGIDPRIPVMADAEFFYTIETLNYWQVKNLPSRNERFIKRLSARKHFEKILTSPDRGTASGDADSSSTGYEP